MLYILTGNGKGKTTCAIGMGLRAVGAGLSVLMIQFLKSGRSSENKVLQQVDGFEVESFGRDVCISKENVCQKDFDLVKQGFGLAKKWLADGRCDFLILDEICLALHFGLLDRKEILEFLSCPAGGRRRGRPDIVLTGRYCPKEILKIADLVTEFKEIKHYYKKGIKVYPVRNRRFSNGARKGIEY